MPGAWEGRREGINGFYAGCADSGKDSVLISAHFHMYTQVLDLDIMGTNAVI
jgi:hypothetical protein